MNFPLIMLILLIITGGIVLLDRYVLQRRRGPDGLVPWWVEYPKSFFPVILVVFFLRSGYNSRKETSGRIFHHDQ